MMFDNFLSSARAKWGERSGLTLFLPHSFEGQGPEHSSARLERFLQLAAENNSTVVNLSSASNYFHLLRAQAASLDTQEMRPLIVMSPKVYYVTKQLLSQLMSLLLVVSNQSLLKIMKLIKLKSNISFR